ncbi:MAG: hypothetical protein ACXAEU_07910 [Candidatus Hodarchaeales archaeon]|jgi:hypothetical protein
MEKNETSWRTEICDCNDSSCQLFFNSREKSFDIAGDCNNEKLCTQIMKDKHLAKIESQRFREKENRSKINRKPVFGTTQQSSSNTVQTRTRKARKSDDEPKYKSLISFF